MLMSGRLYWRAVVNDEFADGTALIATVLHSLQRDGESQSRWTYMAAHT
jgi:hypothetical protein